jgi:hypothetical protein
MEVRMDSQEYQGKAPDFGICSRSGPSLDLELASFGIVAIAVDPAKQELYFVRLEKTPSWFLCDLLGEVDHKDISKDTDADCHDAFEDEDPSPAVVACSASLADEETSSQRLSAVL